MLVTKKMIEVIPVKNIASLPIAHGRLVFTEELTIRPRGLPQIVIDPGVIGSIHHRDGKLLITVANCDYAFILHSFREYVLISTKSSTITSVMEDVSGKVIYLACMNGWSSRYKDLEHPLCDRVSLIFWILENADKKSLRPPMLEPMVKQALSFCETHEFYEDCVLLMKWLDQYRKIHKAEFEKKPLLKITAGYGWLFSKRVGECA